MFHERNRFMKKGLRCRILLSVTKIDIFGDRFSAVLLKNNSANFLVQLP